MVDQAGRLRRIIVGLSTVAAVVAVSTGPAGSQATTTSPTTTSPATTVTTEQPAGVPEVEVIDVYASGSSGYRDCDGGETPIGSGFVDAYAQRSGDDDEPLVVPVTFSGPAAAGLGEASDLEFFADDSEGFAFAELGREASGTLTVTFEPGPGYTLVGPASFDFEVSASDIVIDCNDPIPLGDDRTHQTIVVGDRPEPLFEDLLGDDAEEFFDFIDTVVLGDLPPGLTYVDDEWGGAATTPGTYDFQVRACVDPDADFGEPLSRSDAGRRMGRMQRAQGDADTPCFGTADVRIEVLPAEVVAPTMPAPEPIVPEPIVPVGSVAPPAAPIDAPADFTG